jgi:hypothetical protein
MEGRKERKEGKEGRRDTTQEGTAKKRKDGMKEGKEGRKEGNGPVSFKATKISPGCTPWKKGRKEGRKEGRTEFAEERVSG